MLSQDLIEKTVSFHGHHCPGLTIGIRAGQWCLQELGSASDEEIVAIVETDMCGVDAIQFLTGCTFGKGNFVFQDYGKAAFSFFRRSDGKSARLLLNRDLVADLREKQNALAPDDEAGRREIRQQMIERMMAAPFEEMFAIGRPQEEMPLMARIHKSLPCFHCGEEVMETRLKRNKDQVWCIPCANRMQLNEKMTSMDCRTSGNE